MVNDSFDFSQFLNRAKEHSAYWLEGLILEFTEEMTRRMDELDLSRSELARRIDTSPAYVTKLLRGTTNFTMETMVKVARALKCEVRLRLQPEGVCTKWFEVLKWASSASVSPVDWVSEEQKYGRRQKPGDVEETDEIPTAA